MCWSKAHSVNSRPCNSLSQHLCAKVSPACPHVVWKSVWSLYRRTLLSETLAAVVSLFQSKRKHTQLCDSCVKPQILEGNAPVTEWDCHPSPSKPDLRTTSPHQAHTPQTNTWHYVCPIPALFIFLQVSCALVKLYNEKWCRGHGEEVFLTKKQLHSALSQA